MQVKTPPSKLLCAVAACTLIAMIYFIDWSCSPADPTTYLPFTFGYAALQQTLEAYDQAGWKDIVIVDNSPNHIAWTHRLKLLTHYRSLREVITTPVQLRFSQLQAYLDHLAMEAGAEVYLWGHTDALLLSNGTSPYSSMLQCLQWGRHQNIATVFFDYDRFNAVFTAPAAAVPWDPAMPQYAADCDRYRRQRIAGYGVEECPIPIGKVVHTSTVLSRLERDELWAKETLNEKLDYIAVHGKGGNWKEKLPKDNAAFDAEHAGGNMYFKQKWGVDISPSTCPLEGWTPNW